MADRAVPVSHNTSKVLIHWARIWITRWLRVLRPWRAAVLMIRFTTATIVLHILQIVQHRRASVLRLFANPRATWSAANSNKRISRSE